jgi:hyperosmotically inducible periplasmic protein
VIGALIRTFLKGVFALVLLAAAFAVYSLYRSGDLPFVQKAIEDATVVGSVKAALAIHRDLADRGIRVEIDRGRVVLSGKVATETEKSEAGALAQSVDGVKQIDNRLEVDPNLETRAADDRSLGERLDDVTLLAKVRAALSLDRETRPLDLEVSVRSGSVLLRGTVPTESMRKRVLDRVAAVGGVEKLEDQLEVEVEVVKPAEEPRKASSSGREPERFQ